MTIYFSQFPPHEPENEDVWVSPLNNIYQYCSDRKDWLSAFDPDECGCSHPNAMPPCGYCENGEYHMVAWTDLDELDDYSTYTYKTPESIKDKLDRLKGKSNNTSYWEQRALDAEDRLQEIEQGFANKYYEEYKRDNEYQIREELWEDLYPSVRDEIIATESKNLRPEIEAQIRAEIREEVRLELLKEINKASELI